MFKLQSPIQIQQLSPRTTSHLDRQWAVRSFNVKVTMNKTVRVNLMIVDDQKLLEGIDKLFEGQREDYVYYCDKVNRSRVVVRRFRGEGQWRGKEVGGWVGKGMDWGKKEIWSISHCMRQTITYLATRKLFSNQSISFSFDHDLFSGIDALILNQKYFVYGQKTVLPLQTFLKQAIPKGYTVERFKGQIKRLIDDVHCCGVVLGIAKSFRFDEEGNFEVDVGEGVMREMLEGQGFKEMLNRQSEGDKTVDGPEDNLWSISSFGYDLSSKKIVLDLSSVTSAPLLLNQPPYTPSTLISINPHLIPSLSIDLYSASITQIKKFISCMQQTYFNSQKPQQQFFGYSFSEPRINSGFQTMVLKNEAFLGQLAQKQHCLLKAQCNQTSQMVEIVKSVEMRGKVIGLVFAARTYVDFLNGYQRTRNAPFNSVIGLVDQHKLIQRHSQKQSKPHTQKLSQHHHSNKPTTSELHSQMKQLAQLLTDKYQLQHDYTCLSQLLTHQKHLLINKYVHSCDIDVILEMIEFKLASIVRPTMLNESQKEEAFEEYHSVETSPSNFFSSSQTLAGSKRALSLENRENGERSHSRSEDVGSRQGKIKMGQNCDESNVRKPCSYQYEDVPIWEEISLARNYSNLLYGNVTNTIKSKLNKKPGQNYFNIEDFKHQILSTLRHTKQQIQNVQQSLSSKTFDEVQNSSHQISEYLIFSSIDHNLIILELSYRYNFYLSIYYRLPEIYDIQKTMKCLQKCRGVLQKALKSIDQLIQGNRSFENSCSSDKNHRAYQQTIFKAKQMTKTFYQGRIFVNFQILKFMVWHLGRSDQEVESVYQQLSGYVGQYYGEYHQFNLQLLLLQFKLLHLKQNSVKYSSEGTLGNPSHKSHKQWMLQIFIRIKQIQVINGQHRMSNWAKSYPFMGRKLSALQRQIKKLTLGKEQMKLLIESSLQSYKQASTHYSNGLWKYSRNKADYSALSQNPNPNQTLESIFTPPTNPHQKPSPQTPSLYQHKTYTQVRHTLFYTCMRHFNSLKSDELSFSVIEGRLEKVYGIVRESGLWKRVEKIMADTWEVQGVTVLEGELGVCDMMVAAVQIGYKCYCVNGAEKRKQLSKALLNHIKSLSCLSKCITSSKLSSQFFIPVKFMQTIAKTHLIQLQSITQLRQSGNRQFLKSLLQDIQFFKCNLSVHNDSSVFNSPQFRRMIDHSQLLVILLLNDRLRLKEYYSQKLLAHTMLTSSSQHNYSSIISPNKNPNDSDLNLPSIVQLPSTLRHSPQHLTILAQLQLQQGRLLTGFEYLQESFNRLVGKSGNLQLTQFDHCLMVENLALMIKVLLKWSGFKDSESYNIQYGKQRMQSILELLKLTSLTSQSQSYHFQLISFIYFITMWLSSNVLKKQFTADSIIADLIKEPFQVSTQLIDLAINILVDTSRVNSHQDETVIFLIYQVIFLAQTDDDLNSNNVRFLYQNSTQTSQDQMCPLPKEVTEFVIKVSNKLFDQFEGDDNLPHIMRLFAIKWFQSSRKSEKELQNLTQLSEKALSLSLKQLNIIPETLDTDQIISLVSTRSFRPQAIVRIHILLYLKHELLQQPNKLSQTIVESMIDFLMKQKIKLSWFEPLIQWGYGVLLNNRFEEQRHEPLNLDDTDFLTRILRFINSHGIMVISEECSNLKNEVDAYNSTQKQFHATSILTPTRQHLYQTLFKYLTNRHLHFFSQAFIKQTIIFTNFLLKSLLSKNHPKSQNLSQPYRQILSNLCFEMLKLISRVVQRQLEGRVIQDSSVIKDRITLLMYLGYSQEVSCLVGKKESLLGRDEIGRIAGKIYFLLAQLALDKIRHHKTIGKLTSIIIRPPQNNETNPQNNIKRLSSLIISHLQQFPGYHSKLIRHSNHQNSLSDTSLEHYIDRYLNHLAHFVKLTSFGHGNGQRSTQRLMILVNDNEESQMKIEVRQIGDDERQGGKDWDNQDGLGIGDIDVIEDEKEKLDHYMCLMEDRCVNYLKTIYKAQMLTDSSKLTEPHLQYKVNGHSSKQNLIFLKLIYQIHSIFTSSF